MILQDKIDELTKIIQNIGKDEINEITEEIMIMIQQKGTLYVCGNGGSGATANMFDELVFELNQFFVGHGLESRVKSYSLNMSTVHLAETIEQESYPMFFGNLLLYKGMKKDLLIAISGSGNSKNVIEVIKVASELDMMTIGLTGMGGGIVSKIVKKGLIVDSNDIQQVENVHSIILHLILNEVKERILVSQ